MSQPVLTDVDFHSLGLHPNLLRGLDEAGFHRLTPIQALALPPALQGEDIAGQAQTGTGKTAAFLLAVMQRLLTQPAMADRRPTDPRALILAPTRELAIQIHKDAVLFGAYSELKLGLAYGGIDYDKQRRELEAGVDILIGTPGRLIDYLKQHVYSLRSAEAVVMDEADRMFDLGFIKDVRFLLRRCPPREQRQGMLFSATLSYRVMELAYEHMNEARKVEVESDSITAAQVTQKVYFPASEEKLPLLVGLMKRMDATRSIVFVNTKHAAEQIANRLNQVGLPTAVLSGDVPQNKRQTLLGRFGKGEVAILVATDVAARGLHIPDVSHVFNYDLPQDPEDYVHRIGRTGRAGRTGEAILFVTARERHLLRAIERSTRQPIEAFNPPTADKVNDQRIARFFERIQSVLAEGDLEPFKSLLARFVHDNEIPSLDVAAALARAAQGDQPLLLQPDPPPPPKRERQPHPRDRSNADRPAPGGSPYRDRYAEQSGRGMDAPAAAGT
ncbi:MAG: DEAD/DEAH box helicase, partial [Xanthomonadales bacterium]|nr:DEAD/DEAH box helicase [Xanthomonadales bacterium]